MSGLLLTISLPLTNNRDYNLTNLAKAVSYTIFLQTKLCASRNIEAAKKVLNTKNVEANVKKLIAAGVPPQKMIIDLPLKGATYDTNIIYGSYFNEFIGYNETCTLLMNDEALQWQRSYLNKSDVAILENSENNRAIVTECSRSLANKARFATKIGLAGFYTGPVQMDDFEGKCIEDEDTFADYRPAVGITLHIPQRNSMIFPLIRTINEAIVVTLDEIRQSHRQLLQGSASNHSKPINKPVASPNTTHTNPIQGNSAMLMSCNLIYMIFAAGIAISLSF